MVRIRSQNEIALSLLDFFRAAQPNLDTKPGSVARDVAVDGFSIQVSRLYEELQRNSTLSSLRLAIGSDLDRLASNFGVVRKRGTKSSGPALMTFKEILSEIGIIAGSTVTARNGATFIVSTTVVVSPVNINSYKAVASANRADLDLAGITDDMAVEVLVEAVATGTQGNISKFALLSTDVSGVSNVTNVNAFGGGSAPEDDATFRNRLLSVFGGANTGTALGYKNAALSDPATLDAIVVGPGDPLMTRDGTQVAIAEDGTRTIISDGTGGKVDVYIYGARLQEISDSYIYTDLSNTGDPTNSANNFVLGQIDADEGKTVTKKRIDDLATGTLPDQPVNNIVSVSGSLSGGNFVEKATSSLGVVTGNYELIKDTGVYAGSPWGFDKLHWISNKIVDFPEDLTKGIFNGQDSLSYTDVLEIGKIEQNITVLNENSIVSRSDRSSIQLSHSPCTNVTRVFNATTGERYVIQSQNPDGSGTINQTGRIVISGSSLPAVSDTLQVDYTWIFRYSPNFDYDDRTTNKNIRTVDDSVDWGFSNIVRREETVLTAPSSLLATVTHPISAVASVNKFVQENSTVSLSSIISKRLAVVVTTAVTNIISVSRVSDGAELWATAAEDGTFSGFTIYLPTDTAAEFGDNVTVVYNAVDLFNLDGYEGSFNNNSITLPLSPYAAAGDIVEVNYIANVNTILPATLLSALPALRNNNSFNTTTSTAVGNQPTTHIFSSGSIIKNLRQAPSRLALSIAGSISKGVITIVGTSMTWVPDEVFRASSQSLKINLNSAIKSFLGLTSADTVPSNIKLARLISVEKVDATTNLDVLSVLHSYDITSYAIKDNSYVKDEAITDTSLSNTEVRLPSTTGNLANVPQIGDALRVTFYYVIDNDVENISFSKSGTQQTNKVFAIVNSIAISSGFTSSSSLSSTLTITNMNQPTVNSRYRAFYDYTAPKSNERITIRYNCNKLLSDVTVALEGTRPISADVLAKAGIAIKVDTTMNIVVTTEFKNKSDIVKQNVQDALTTALTATNLATTVDSSDLIATAQGIAGVDRARIIYFNVDGVAGSVLSITAQENEYIAPNIITVVVEER